MPDVVCTISRTQNTFISSNEPKVAMIGAKGCGKAQPLSEPVLTDVGFKFMREIQVGNSVIGADGKPKKVRAVHPQGVIDVYEVLMSDGTLTRASGDHLWFVTDKKGYKIRTTNELRVSDTQYYVPYVTPLEEGYMGSKDMVKSISAIKYLGKEECQCIEVEGGLYVTNDYIVTHNSWSGARFVLSEATRQPKEQHLVMYNTLRQARDMFYQDFEPLLKELHWHYHFNPQNTNLKIFDTIVHFRSAETDTVQNIESVAYGTGWADEASFYDPESLKIFLSRIRKGSSKVRITSMPDEPDHWIYDLLDRAGFLTFEMSLHDNPDKDFVEKYEKILKATYEGAQLQRYLSGERVSLAGIGLFSIKPEMKRKFKFDHKHPIVMSWDFNVDYRAVSVWQRVGTGKGGGPVIACLRSYQMKEATVYEDALKLAHLYKDHKEDIFMTGDASGSARSAQATESIWMTIKRAFREVGTPIRFVVPARNPNVKDTIQCVNWGLRSGRVLFDESERNVYRSLAACRADKFGEIDKSKDGRGTGAQTHEADTARYAIWFYFDRLYPGGTRKIFVV